MQCDPVEKNDCDAGCNGGLMTTAFEYTLKAGGLQLEKDYPYTGRNGKCHFDKSYKQRDSGSLLWEAKGSLPEEVTTRFEDQ